MRGLLIFVFVATIIAVSLLSLTVSDKERIKPPAGPSDKLIDTELKFLAIDDDGEMELQLGNVGDRAINT
jgi:hypothetical protein